MKKQNKKKSKNIFRYFKSTKVRLIGFAIIFALIGAITLNMSRASVGQLLAQEAELTTLKNASVFSDPAASNGKMARLYTNGSSAKLSNFSLSKSASKVVIAGYGRLCSGAPIIKIELDGKSIGQINMLKTSLANYTLEASIPSGTHTLIISYINDYYKNRRCDRDAYVDKISMLGETSSTAPVPTPTPTPSPVPEPAPAQGTLLFDGTRLSNFALVQSAAPDRIQEVIDPLGSGKTVLKFHVCDGDTNNGYASGTCSTPTRDTPTDNPRAQALSKDFIKDGMEYWVHDEILFPTNFPDKVNGWYGVLTTAYGEPFGGSSPVSLVLDDSSDLQLQRNATYGYDTVWRMPKPRGSWISITIHEKFSSSGFIEMWVNGKQVTFNNGQKILYMQTQDRSNNGSANHAKITSYREKGILTDTTLYHRNFKIGTTKEIVEH